MPLITLKTTVANSNIYCEFWECITGISTLVALRFIRIFLSFYEFPGSSVVIGNTTCYCSSEELNQQNQMLLFQLQKEMRYIQHTENHSNFQA